MRTRRKIGLLAIVGILALMGFVAVQAATENGVDTMVKASAKGCTMGEMRGCVAECMKTCDKNMGDLAAAMTALDGANKAIDAGKTAEAKVEIAKAQKLLKGIEQAQKKCMGTMPVCNAQCPISGKKLDMMNVPENCTTMYKGQKMGFCSPACPAAWKMLPDAEKDAKLKTSMLKDIEVEKEMMKEKVENVIQ